MTRHAIQLLALLLLGCSTAYKENPPKTAKAVNAEFVRFTADTLRHASYPDFTVDRAYECNGFKLLFGLFESVDGHFSKHDNEADNGLRLLVLDQKNQLILKSQGQFDSYYFRPQFYRSGGGEVIILAETGAEYSWGNTVFLLDKTGATEIGNISLAMIDKAQESHQSIAAVTKIERKGKDIVFSFDADSVIFDPGGINETTIAGREFSYVYDGTEFEIQKSGH